MKALLCRRGALVLATLAAVGVLAGCAVGPDTRTPTAPEVARYTATALPAATVGSGEGSDRAQRFVDAATVAPDWWTGFGSAELDALVARALARSPTIAAAEAALRAAQELGAAQRGALLPSADASYSGTRAGTPAAVASPLSSGASVYTLHTAQLSVGYVVDVFGGTRRAIEAQDAQTDTQAWQLRAAQLTLAANVASAALQEASLREQLAATERLADIAEKQWKLLGAQRRLGAAPGAAVLAQEALWRQAQAAAAALRRQRAQQHDLLALLVGSTPAELPALELQLAGLQLPDVPVTLPGALLAQRPDVRAAAAQLRAANAQLGVAAANMLPQISLGAGIGSSAQTISGLFGAGGALWNLAAGVSQPLFQGGALLHRKRAAEAQLDQAVAQYQGTVLVAFQNVADALEAVRHDADVQVAAQAQAQAAAAALRIAQRQVELGDISVLTLLSSETAALQAEIAAVQARAGRSSDLVAVYQALGGGWGTGTPGPLAQAGPVGTR